jgi:hypothetical protein
MTNQNLAETVLLMEPNIKSIVDAAREILSNLKIIDKESINTFGEPVSFFFEGVTQTVLDWMGTGEIEQVRDLLEQMDKVLREEAEDRYCLDSLSLNNQLTIKLQNLEQFIAIFLRTSNLSKFMGLLIGDRRASWRKALKYIYHYNQSVRPGDLLKWEVFNSDSTASNALNKLAAIGLLEKLKSDSNAAIYELTWAGRSVCRMLSRDETAFVADESSSDTITEEYREKCHEAQKKRQSNGGCWSMEKTNSEIAA